MIDVAEYIGLPFQERGRTRAGVDCWGLYRLVILERLGVTLPLHDLYETTDDRHAIAAAVAGEQVAEWQPVTDPLPYDLVLLRIYGQPLHVGLYAGPGLMLHIERGKNAVLERIDRTAWRNRMLGFWRSARIETAAPAPLASGQCLANLSPTSP